MSQKDDFFLKQMKGVNPIKKNNRINKNKPKTKHTLIKKTNTSKTKTTPTITNKNIKRSEFSLEKINLKKSIKKGSFSVSKKIDFHGQSLSESEERFTSSILEYYNSGDRCLLFVTGKGLYKSKNIEEDKPKLYHGVIRSAFMQWVKSKRFSKYILSFEQASIEHGGDGAFYVYLRKKKN